MNVDSVEYLERKVLVSRMPENRKRNFWYHRLQRKCITYVLWSNSAHGCRSTKISLSSRLYILQGSQYPSEVCPSLYSNAAVDFHIHISLCIQWSFEIETQLFKQPKLNWKQLLLTVGIKQEQRSYSYRYYFWRCWSCCFVGESN